MLTYLQNGDDGDYVYFLFFKCGCRLRLRTHTDLLIVSYRLLQTDTFTPTPSKMYGAGAWKALQMAGESTICEAPFVLFLSV